MARAGDELVHPLTGERIVFRRTAADTGGELLELDDLWVRADHATLAHVHPGMRERWEVLRGRVGFRIGDDERIADPGDVVVAEPGVAHRAWNLGGGPVHLRIQMTPGRDWDLVVERLFAAGGVDVAALLREFPDELASAPRPSALDASLPGWHFRERHERLLADATPTQAMDALRQLRPADLPVTSSLMALRALPAFALSLIGAARRPPLRGSWLDTLIAYGFVVLASEPEELVLGAIGHFWKPTGGLVTIERPADFVSFRDPGYARGAISCTARPAGDGTRLVTETRVAATDAEALRAFARYWRLVRFGSAIIRREMLTAAARRVKA